LTVSVLQTNRYPSPAIPDLASRPRQLIFFTPLDNPFREFLNEIHQIACAEPAIVERIEHDLDQHAKKKKLLRLADARFLADQTPELPKLQMQLRELRLDEVELECGRPRMEAYVVYLFLMMRGFNGGCKDQHSRLFLEESITLRLWLEPLGLELPPASTLSENLNAVSNETRAFIQQAQLRYILGAGLDDFQKCFIDSTAVEANTDRPTDSALLVKLIDRVCTAGASLHRVGLPNFNSVGLAQQQLELRRMSQQILFLNGKARGEGKRRKLYFQLMRRALRLRKRLARELEPIHMHLAERVDLLPSRRILAEEAVKLIADDLAALEQAASVCERRVMKEEKVPMAEKIISLSDADASFIVKGGWNTVIGYRPQVARSGQGFVTALLLPVGNAADSPHLAPMVQEQITNTGIVPTLASADDGYSSEDGRAQVLAMGVKAVSISGAKGKKIIEPEQWKSALYRGARAERSAIESLIFTLKHCFAFGELMRRTHQNVLAELLEKVLAYNICQMIRVRQRLREEPNITHAAA
jgi:hypothetical protein